MLDQTEEIENFLRKHLIAIQNNDIDAYHQSTSPELTLYEWWITPHRIDGLGFHDFMMESNAARGVVFGASGDKEKGGEEKSTVRFDLANLKIQQYPGVAIASYTLLTSTADESGLFVNGHNESRVLVQENGRWQVVHVHKSPGWPAPHVQP